MGASFSGWVAGPASDKEQGLTESAIDAASDEARSFGGAGGIRTRYLNTAGVALSQLSYSPNGRPAWI